MTWLTVRQFRVPALAGGAASLAIVIYLLVLGMDIHHAGTGELARYDAQISALGYALIAVPGIIGMFWGAPLIARELEAGTHRLVWNQSVTRGRWLAVKLAVIGVLSVAVTGAYSMLLTWAAGPLDTVEANRFAPLLFDARNIAPLAYAAFACTLGATLGLLLRRTVPAMAATFAIFVAIQILTPTLVRPNFVAPVDTRVALTAPTVDSLTFFGDDGTIGGLKLPGAWIVSTSPMLDTAGQDIGHTTRYSNCLHAPDLGACFGKENLHVQASVQPADRYWTFQSYETALFAALTAILAGLCFWRIRHHTT